MHLTYEDKASIKLDRQQKTIKPVDYLSGCSTARCVQSSDLGLEDLKDRVRTCWASLDQQLINKAIDPWRQTWKTVVKVHEGTLNSCLLDCMPLMLLYEFFAVLLRHTRKHAFPVVFHHCDIIQFD